VFAIVLGIELGSVVAPAGQIKTPFTAPQPFEA
jgi:hypothetical protein